MAITYVAGATCATSASTSASITIPATVQADDILVLDVSTKDNNGVTVSDNDTGGNAWTQKGSATTNGASFIHATYWKRATSGTAGKVISIQNGTINIVAIAEAYRGCIASGDPIEAILSEANASGNQTQAGITTLTDGAWVILVVSHGDDRTISNTACTSPGALTIRHQMLNATSSPDAAMGHASAEKATAGATGAFTWAWSSAALGVSRAYALTPAAGGPTPTRGQTSFVELEVPSLATRGRVAFVELEAPNVATRGRVSWAEFEVPQAPTRGRVSYTEFEVPNVPATPSRGQVSLVEFESPDPPGPTRGQVSWVEVETTNGPTRGQVSWVELQAPDVDAGEEEYWCAMTGQSGIAGAMIKEI